jgi:hypothetical protein
VPEAITEPALTEVAVPADHELLLHELAGYVRDIPLPARNKYVTDAVAFLADKGL